MRVADARYSGIENIIDVSKRRAMDYIRAAVDRMFPVYKQQGSDQLFFLEKREK